MKLPANPWQNLSSAQKIIFILASLCAVGLIGLAVMVLTLRSKQQATLTQADSVPIQDCQPLTLVLGETTFKIQNLNRAADGSLSVPPDTSGIVYWVEGTKNSPVFLLSHTPDNLAVVSKINIGSEATATWSDCASTTYRVLSHKPASFNAATLPDQSQKGITVFFSINSSGEGFVFTGEVVAEQPAPSVANTVATTSVNPTIVIPTPDCGKPTLVLGTTTFKIQNISRAPDGSLAVPAGTSGIAYWVEGTVTNYVFVLSPMPENLAAMSTITVGSPATVTWSDCSSTSFVLLAPIEGSINRDALPEQTEAGITVFFQTDPSGASFVFRGGLAEEAVDVIDTPMADESGILAEISLLEITTSPDGTTIKVNISIRNYGQSAFTLSSDNVSLTPPDAAMLALAGSSPRLPDKIKPGEIKTFELTFPRPSSATATLKIFTVEYDIEGY